MKHQPESTPNNRNSSSPDQDSVEFFLPSFCEGRAVFILVLVTELFVLAMVLAASGVQSFSWNYLALVSIFVQWIVLTSAAALCWLRRYLAGFAQTTAILIIYAMVLGITLLVGFAAEWVLAGARFSLAGIELDGYSILRNLIVSAIMTGMVLRYFYVQTLLRKQQQAELQSRIQALQSRIRPHFLFNSMNIIASLIATDPDTAEKVVEDLSELFRASLKGTNAPVRFDQELALCRRYIDIEQLRLGQRLQVDWHVDDLPANATVPLLTLQPLLENAIYHGIQPLPEGGVISVVIQVENGAIKLTVSNPYHASSATEAATTGGETVSVSGVRETNRIALDNTRSRLQAFYGDRAKLSTHVAEGVFVTQLSWPLSDNPGVKA